MTQKEGIFLSIAQNDIHAVIHVLINALDSKEKLALKDMYELFNQVESSLYWDHVKHHTLHSIESYCSSQSYADVHIAGNTEESHNQFMTVKAIANGIFDFCQVSKFKPSSLLDILLAMQNLLLVNDNDNSSELKPIKMLISKTSEYFWVHEEEGAEYLMPNLLTHLLMISLDVHGRDTDIKRVYSLRGAFLLLDFEDPSIDFLVSLIHRCFTHPGYLKGLEGRKLLAFLLQSNGGLLVDSVSRIIRPQLLTGVDAVASSYGEIMYLSWKESSLFDSNKGVHKGSSSKSSCNSLVGSPNQLTQNLRVRTALEDLMQTLLRECVHASEMKYFRGLRSMIKSFHDTTRTDELNGMLLRVYDPIIWRSLRSANAKVRAQAAIMFLDVFPLQHEDVRAEDDDKILQKQFDLLSALLKDPDHQVRTNAVLGVCNILKEYWEVLPINTTHTILKFLVDTLAFDSSSANVRYSLFIGIGVLLQQPLTHDLMKHLLPMLKLSIHDKSEKVRIAFVKILCQVKSIRGMHFYEIVPVDHLLERLAEDHHRPHVCHVMTQLLLNSFYPQEQNHDNTLLSHQQQHQQLEYQQISRCVQFIEMNPIAAEAFYSTLYEHISVGCIAKLITMLFSFLLASEQSPDKVHTMKISSQVNTKDKKRLRAGLVIYDKNKDSNNNSNSSVTVGEVDSVMDDLNANKRLPYPVRLGLMRVINCLLESVSNQFEIQEPARNLVCRYLTIDKTKWLLRQCAIPLPQDEVKEDSAAAAAAQHLIPVAFKLVASAKMLARMDVNHAAVGDNYQESVSNDFNTLVMTIFVPTWKAINGDVSATNASALRSVLATSVINIARSSKDEVVLLGLIDQSLDLIDATIAPSKIVARTKAVSSTSRSKASKKNKKSLTDNIDIDIISVIPFEAAIDLLVAYDISDRNLHVVCCDEQHQSILNSIFIKVRHHCEASIDGDHALAVVNESLCKAIKVWVSRSIRSDALLLLDGIHSTSNAFSELMKVIQWCDDKVIKNVVSLSMDDSPIVATSIAFNIFMIVLAEMSDIIYLQLADHSVYRTIANWMEETMLSIRYPTEASVSSFQPLVARLISLICTPATTTASSNIEGEDENKTLTQMHRLRNVMLKYLLTTITLVKGTNNQKLIMALLAANPTKYDDILRTAVIHVLHAIIRSPDDDFQMTAHVVTLSILNILTSMKLVKQTHKVIVDMKSALHTTITTNTSSSILTNSEYDAVCKLLTIVEQLSMDRNNISSGTQATALDKDRCIVKSALKNTIVPPSVAIDPEQWTTI